MVGVDPLVAGSRVVYKVWASFLGLIVSNINERERLLQYKNDACFVSHFKHCSKTGI